MKLNHVIAIIIMCTTVTCLVCMECPLLHMHADTNSTAPSANGIHLLLRCYMTPSTCTDVSSMNMLCRYS